MLASLRRPPQQIARRAAPLSLGLLVLLLSACGGGGSNFTNHGTNGGSGNIGTSNNTFDGHLLFVKAGNIFILNGKDDSLTQVTSDGNDYQPSLSPDGKTLVFEVRKPGNDYSDLAIMPLGGGTPTMLTDDSLHNKNDGPIPPHDHYQFWAANPIWTADGQNIIYLSDFFKGAATTPSYPNPTCTSNSEVDWILDMGIVELPASARPVPGGQLNDRPKLLSWPYCYAGGDQNLSLRPGTTDTEVLFTSFQYTGPQESLVAYLSVLEIPAGGGNSSVVQLSPPDPNALPMEPSWSPDGKYITYIRRENGQDNLYIMPVDATITGTPNQEVYGLEGNGKSTYYTNTTYYGESQRLASGIIGNPVWGSNNTLFFMMFANGEFNLYMAKVKFTNPTPTATPKATPGTTPTASAPAGPIITLDGDPMQLTQGGVDGTTAPIWYH